MSPWVPQSRGTRDWPEHLPVGALRVVRWSARYDQTVIFYRDTIGLPVLETFHDSYGLDGTILGLPGGPVHLEIVRLSNAPHPAPGLDQLVFYLPDAAAQERIKAQARRRRRPPGCADRLLGGQRRRHLPGPGRARSSVRVLDLWPAEILIRDLSAEGMIDGEAATAAWEQVLELPQWEGKPGWLHGDLMPGNLLTRHGRLTGVIDFGADADQTSQRTLRVQRWIDSSRLHIWLRVSHPVPHRRRRTNVRSQPMSGRARQPIMPLLPRSQRACWEPLAHPTRSRLTALTIDSH